MFSKQDLSRYLSNIFFFYFCDINISNQMQRYLKNGIQIRYKSNNRGRVSYCFLLFSGFLFQDYYKASLEQWLGCWLRNQENLNCRSSLDMLSQLVTFGQTLTLSPTHLAAFCCEENSKQEYQISLLLSVSQLMRGWVGGQISQLDMG